MIWKDLYEELHTHRAGACSLQDLQRILLPSEKSKDSTFVLNQCPYFVSNVRHSSEKVNSFSFPFTCSQSQGDTWLPRPSTRPCLWFLSLLKLSSKQSLTPTSSSFYITYHTVYNVLLTDLGHHHFKLRFLQQPFHWSTHFPAYLTLLHFLHFSWSSCLSQIWSINIFTEANGSLLSLR